MFASETHRAHTFVVFSPADGNYFIVFYPNLPTTIILYFEVHGMGAGGVNANYSCYSTSRRSLISVFEGDDA